MNFLNMNRLQAAVDEINAVCKKHGIVLVGVSNGEQVYGEILVHEVGTHSQWSKPETLPTKLEFLDHEFYTTAIGTKE